MYDEKDIDEMTLEEVKDELARSEENLSQLEESDEDDEDINIDLDNDENIEEEFDARSADETATYEYVRKHAESFYTPLFNLEFSGFEVTHKGASKYKAEISALMLCKNMTMDEAYKAAKKR